MFDGIWEPEPPPEPAGKDHWLVVLVVAGLIAATLLLASSWLAYRERDFVGQADPSTMLFD